MYASHGKKTQDGLEGTIRTFGYKFPFALKPNPRQQTDKSPTHIVVTKDSHGPVQIGIAWERQLERGNYAGLSMFSLIVNDPSFDRELGFSAFPMNNAGDYDIALDRVRKETGQSAAGQAGETLKTEEGVAA